MKKYVITDIHGCLLTFKALLDTINFSTQDKLFLLGDFIDRGPDSKGVIDTIIELKKNGYNVECIRGNHEEAMLKSRYDQSHGTSWWTWGGKEALASFGHSNLLELNKVENDYWNWLNELPHFIEEEEYIMVHAGLNFAAPDPMNDYENMLWIRHWYNHINYRWLANRKIIHGHTPTSEAQIKLMLKNLDQDRYIGIDNGCFKNVDGQGQLCAFELTNQKLFFQKRMDKLSWRT